MTATLPQTCLRMKKRQKLGEEGKKPNKLSKGQLWRARQQKIGTLSELKGKKALLIVTNRGREKLGTQETINILNLEADEAPHFSSDDEANNEDRIRVDIEAELKREIQSLQQKKTETYDVGMECLTLLRLQDDPLVSIERFFKKILEERKSLTTFIERLIPMQMICYPSVDSIKTICEPEFKKIFTEDISKEFSISVKMRGSGESINKTELIEKIAALIDQKKHPVNLTEPSVIINIEIIKNIAGISIIPGELFRKCRKFNVRTFGEYLHENDSSKT